MTNDYENELRRHGVDIAAIQDSVREALDIGRTQKCQAVDEVKAGAVKNGRPKPPPKPRKAPPRTAREYRQTVKDWKSAQKHQVNAGNPMDFDFLLNFKYDPRGTPGVRLDDFAAYMAEFFLDDDLDAAEQAKAVRHRFKYEHKLNTRIRDYLYRRKRDYQELSADLWRDILPHFAPQVEVYTDAHGAERLRHWVRRFDTVKFTAEEERYALGDYYGDHAAPAPLPPAKPFGLAALPSEAVR